MLQPVPVCESVWFSHRDFLICWSWYRFGSKSLAHTQPWITVHCPHLLPALTMHFVSPPLCPGCSTTPCSKWLCLGRAARRGLWHMLLYLLLFFSFFLFSLLNSFFPSFSRLPFVAYFVLFLTALSLSSCFSNWDQWFLGGRKLSLSLYVLFLAASTWVPLHYKASSFVVGVVVVFLSTFLLLLSFSPWTQQNVRVEIPTLPFPA